MKTLIHLCILSVAVIIFTCCKNDNTQNKQNQSQDTKTESSGQNREIEQIDALYYNYVFEAETPIKPEDLRKNIPQFEENKNGILDAQITDSLKISKLRKLFTDLHPSEKQTLPDARIIFILKYKDISTDTLSISGMYTDKIYLNGIEQTANNELLFTLKNYIGLYPWLIGDDMFNMKELQDNSFLKPPFTSDKYYKQYSEYRNRL